MSLLPRLRAWLGSLFASAADPRANTVSVYRLQVELLERLEVALGEVTASKRHLQEQAERMTGYLPRLEAQARGALHAGREDVARLVLVRRREVAAELRRLEDQAAEVVQEEERLAVARERLEARIEALHSRQEVASARYTAAKAQVRINDALAGVSEDLADFGAALEQAEARTEYLQARATAIDERTDSGAIGQMFWTGGSGEDKMLDPEDALAVERELEALKRDIGPNAECKILDGQAEERA